MPGDPSCFFTLEEGEGFSFSKRGDEFLPID